MKALPCPPLPVMQQAISIPAALWSGQGCLQQPYQKFVMWLHIDKNDYSYAHAGVAVSDQPAGPYTYLGSVKPNGQDSRDMTLFKDDDGKAYLIHASEGNNTMQICLLTDDYLSPSATYSRVLVNRNREARLCLKAVAGISSSHLPVPAGRQTPLLMRWQIARLARGKNRKPMHRPKRRNYF